MAIISCPFCGQKISDKSPQCSGCKQDLSNLSAEKLESLARDKRLSKSQSLMNHGMLSMLLFLGGFGSIYWFSPAQGSLQQIAFMGLSAIGFCWYIITRIRIMLLKKGRK
ncbi:MULTISPECIES: zinc ribbon domain-containing protein [unclassified Rheinheimera]|uniref:zinc ribbon domain-containing protein n=1 Tax=unclassified Rheinheimera TaxID=115860 RepID=UPI0027327982|nr:zinc ribbon domain-containing protein [Rheinheimera sp.]MDP2713409.1 zinc ribbon domain-containing protein [Rheinheimera sp.]